MVNYFYSRKIEKKPNLVKRLGFPTIHEQHSSFALLKTYQ